MHIRPWPALLLALAGMLALCPAASAEPGRLPDNAIPEHYTIRVTPDTARMVLQGEARIRVHLRAPAREIVLNAADLDIRRATLDGRPARIALDAHAETLTLGFAKPVSAGLHTLRIDYRGKILRTPSGVFMLDYRDPDGSTRQMLTTQFEPGDARRFAPLWDEPARKARFDIELVIPPGQVAVSNMPLRSQRLQPGGRQLLRFQTTPRMSSYLLHLSVGDLERLSRVVDGVDIGVVTRRGFKAQGELALQAAADVLRYYKDYFGLPYPLPKLDLIAAPGTSQTFGAMENWGAILFFESVLLFDPERSSESHRQLIFRLVAHEVAHQWFGNLVTMQWWDDLWLNEAFATWMQSKVTSVLHPQWQPQLDVALTIRERALQSDASAATHSIIQPVPDVRAADQTFDSIAYNKGASVIQMIEALAGPEGFRAGLQRYMREHAYGNAVTDDLWNALAAASGADIARVAHDFTLQPGVPLLHLESSACQDGATALTLSVSRFETGPKAPQALGWQLPAMLQVGAEEPARPLLLAPHAPSSPRLTGCGAVLANAGGSGYYRSAYGPQAAQALVSTFAALPALDQMVLLSDAWALAQNGDAPPGDWFGLAARLRPDAEPTLLRQLAQTLTTIDWLYRAQPEQQALFRSFARNRLQPAFARIGWLPATGEDANVAVLRETLIEALGRFDDPAVIAEARARYERAASDPAALPAAIAEPALTVVAIHADAATWERLAARAAASSSDLQKRQHYWALGGARDPALARRTLDAALTGKAGPVYGIELIGSVAEAHPELAFRFALDHEAAIQAGVESQAQWSFIAGLARMSADAATAAALQDYIDQRIPATLRATARRTLAAIESRRRVTDQQLPAMSDWLHHWQDG